MQAPPVSELEIRCRSIGTIDTYHSH